MWPDGIDSALDRWYVPAEWKINVKGEAVRIKIVISRSAAPAESHATENDESHAAESHENVESHGAESHAQSHAEPWKAAGVSRATWFRRKAEQKAKV